MPIASEPPAPGAKSGGRKLRGWLTIATFAVGLVGLVWIVGTQDLVELEAGLAAVGPWFALSCSAHLVALLLDSVTLQACSGVPGLGLWLFVRASMTGHAVNQATPIVKVGELTKFAILEERMPRARAVAGLLSQNLIMFAANCTLLVIAPIVVLLTMDLDPRASLILASSAIVFGMTGVMVYLILHWGMGSLPFRVMRVLRVSKQRCERWRDTWNQSEQQWREATRTRGTMTRAWISAWLSRLANVAEAALILSLLGSSDPLIAAAISLAGYQLVVWLTPYVPFQAGTAEGGSYMIFSLVGFDPALGVMLELARKARRVVFILVGLGLLAWQRWKLREPPAQASETDISSVADEG